MKALISCAYNMDNCCMEMKFTDGSMILIDSIAIENEAADRTHTANVLRIRQASPEYPCRWNDNSVVCIPERIEYTGCTCNFKTCSKSFKLKKRLPNDPQTMYIPEDTQQTIVNEYIRNVEASASDKSGGKRKQMLKIC